MQEHGTDTVITVFRYIGTDSTSSYDSPAGRQSRLDVHPHK